MNWKKDIAAITVASIASYLTMALVYPDLLIHHKIFFMHQHDTEIPFLSAFALISHYYNGGIQLWNPYDQMTYSFVHLASGFYTIASIMTAAVYILLDPFIEHQGEAFQSIHSICFHSVTILIRTIGGYLLLRRFKINMVIIFISLIYLNTFISTPNYLGLLTNNLYSFFPLLMYFMLRFFEGCKLNDFLASIVVMTLAVANSPLMALGYLYQATHSYLLVGLTGTWFLANKPSIKSVCNYLKAGITLKNIAKAFFIGVLCFSIMLPYLQMEKTLQADFYIPEAFDKASGGRMTNKYSIENYFSKPTTPSHKPKEFLLRSVNSQKNDYFYEWSFIGFSTLLFAGAGFLLSKDRRKHLFFWPIIFLFLILLPRDQFSFLSIGHWLNVLTNPFHYLIRCFGMTAFIIPYFLLPLIALGLQAFKEIIYYNKKESIYFERTPIGTGILVSILTYWSFCLPENGKLIEIGIKTGLFASALALLFLWTLWRENKIYFRSMLNRHRFAITIVGITTVLVIDLILFALYANKNQWSNIRIFAGISSHMEGNDLVNLTYQNPQTLPFREFYSTHEKELIIHHPEASEKYKIINMDTHADGMPQDPESIKWYRLNSRQNSYGSFYKFTHLGRYFFRPTIYHPRHSTYKNLHTDIEAQNYLRSDHRIIFQAKYAIDSDRLNHSQNYRKKVFSELGPADSNNYLTKLINNRDVVSIEGMGEELPDFLSTNNLDNIEGVGNHQTPKRVSTYSFPLEGGQSQNLNGSIQYSFKLPKEFPSFISTSLFTQDKFNMEVSIGNQKLKPAQGKLVLPFTYDLQNISTGKFLILLPNEHNLKNQSATFELKQNPSILDVWKNENDNLGINYSAPGDGWLIFHYPYDKRWKITINEKPVKVYKANKYFIGFPIQKGEHKILVQYWPDTSLRTTIALSIFLVIITFPGLTIVGILRENSNTSLQYSFD